MTTKNFKISIFGILAVVLLMAVPTAINAQEAETSKITRQVSEEEFREAQIAVLDLRSAQQKILRGEDKSPQAEDQMAALDSQIKDLMPILEKHQEQNYAKYYIEPTRKTELEEVELDMRNEVSKLGFENYSVNLNHLTQTIEVVVGDNSKDSILLDLSSKYSSDISIDITIENRELELFACANQTDDCDPVVGGIEIEGGCTLALPVRTGWIWYSYYYATAGHCIADNEDMNQPNEASGEIGDNTDSEEVGDCDCARSDKTGGNAPGSDVWRSSNNYLVVTTESSSRPANGYDLTFSGVSSGFKFGEVVDGSYTFTDGGVNYDLIRHDITDLDYGDSGGPFGDADFSEIVGIELGEYGIIPIASAWEEFDKDYPSDLY